MTFARGAAVDPALRPRRDHGRRDPGHRDGEDGDRVGADRATSCSPRCTRTTRPGAITRLNEMGVEPFLTGSAVSAVLAQRLARKLCTNCCEMYSPTVGGAGRRRGSRPTGRRARGDGALPEGRLPALQPDGLQGPGRRSSSCSMMNDELESLAAQNAPATRSSARPQRAGMRSLWDDGHRQGCRRSDLARRARPRRQYLLTSAMALQPDARGAATGFSLSSGFHPARPWRPTEVRHRSTVTDPASLAT